MRLVNNMTPLFDFPTAFHGLGNRECTFWQGKAAQGFPFRGVFSLQY